MRQAKVAGRRILAWSCHASGVTRRLLRGKVAILSYHRVLTRQDLGREYVQPGMYVDAGVFEAHVRFLARRFHVLTFEDLLRRWMDGDWDCEACYCVITFDDGWVDNYVHAYPVLRRYGLPATIFLPTAFIGTRERFWSDKLAACLRAYYDSEARDARGIAVTALTTRFPWLARLSMHGAGDAIDRAIERCKAIPEAERNLLIDSLRQTLGVQTPTERAFLGWDEIREMSRQGISFGSHSSTHRILTSLGTGELRNEASESLAVLRGSGVRFVPVFCYPNGDVSEAAVQAVRSAGYRAAVAGRFGAETASPDDLFRLRRVTVHNDVTSTTSLLELRMAGLGVWRG